ncbi:hypothetical protein [Anaerosolibacter sp.]|uniref:hypothetical protein n=1 Tax=Anaerosolibacter sp. TaxID=1872527 RepID=UPI0039F0955D
MGKKIYIIMIVLIISLVTACGYQKGSDMKWSMHFGHMNEVITKDFEVHETKGNLKITVDAKIKEGMMTLAIFDPEGNKVWERSGYQIKVKDSIQVVKGSWKAVFDIQNAKNGDIKIRATNKAF